MKTAVETLNLLKFFSEQSAAGLHHKMPSHVIAALMTANNRMIKAVIIENGGHFEITPESLYAMFHNKQHVVASSDEDGNVKLSFAPKESIEQREGELLPL